jgi:predicted PurR-regulated permease PerM
MVVISSKYKVPRGISVLLTYVLVIGILVGVVSSLVPAVIEQTQGFFNAFPNYLSRIGTVSFINSDFLTRFVNNNVGGAPNAIFQFTFSVLNNVVGILTVLVFAFYMLMSIDKLDGQLGAFFGEEKQKEFSGLIDTLEKKMGGWARGELILMVSIGIATYIGLSLLGIPYALPLAIFAGILEIIPYLGPIISAIPSVLIGFGISPVMGLGVATLAFSIQQLENYILVPKVMEKSAGVSPLMTLIALAIGARLSGVVGAIISVPILIILQVLSKKYLIKA